jgi:hypothetical protein
MMTSDTLNKSLRPAVLAQRLIWVAMTFSMLLIPVVVGVMSAGNHEAGVSLSNEVRLALYAIAGVAAIISIFAQRFLLSPNRIQTKLDNLDVRSLATNAKTREVDEAKLAEIRLLDPTETKTLGLARQYQSALMIRLAFSEVVVLSGVMLSVLERRFAPVVPFVLAAIVLDLLAFPRFHKIVEENIARMPQF